jgi:hypothetical protein
VTGKHKYTNELNSASVVTTITPDGGASVQVTSTGKINGALVQSIPITINAVQAAAPSDLVVAKFQVVSKSITSRTSFTATAQFFDSTGDFSAVTAEVKADPAIKNGYDVIVPSKTFMQTTFPQGQPTQVEVTARLHPEVGEGIDISTNTVVTPPPFQLVSVSPIITTANGPSDNTGPLVTFIDPAGEFHNTQGTYQTVVRWGDGKMDTYNNSQYLGFFPDSSGPHAGSFTFNPPPHPYSAVGMYPVSVTVTYTDNTPGKPMVTATFKTNAAVSSPNLVLFPLQAYEGGTALGGGFQFTGILGPGVLADFSDPNPANDRANFTTTVNWGDKTPLDTSATLAPQGNSPYIEVMASHVYQLAGNYTLTLNILDKQSGRVVLTASELVTVTAQPIDYNTQTNYIDSSGNFSGTLLGFETGQFTPATDFTASITWGDSTPGPTPGVVSSTLPNGASGQNFIVTGSHQFPLPLVAFQTYNGSVVITDSDGGQVTTVPISFLYDPIHFP